MQGVNPNAQGVDTVLYLHLAHSGSPLAFRVPVPKNFRNFTVCYSGFPGVFLVAVFNTEGVLVGVSRDETRFQRAPPTAEGFRNTVAILAQGKPSG